MPKGRDLPCVYCGGHHSRAVDVRNCWETSTLASKSPADPTKRRRPEAPRMGQPSGGTGCSPNSPVLGRSVVIQPGQQPPATWKGCDRASGKIEELEKAWRERVPLVIEVAEEPAADEVERRAIWSLSPSFAFPGERLAHAMFANAVDARYGEPRWPLAEEAVTLGARATGPADVMLADGTAAFLDGGPLEWQGALGNAVVIPRLSVLGGSLRPFGANETDALLAPDQLAAVLHPGGTARIIAPAGSGKTRVLTERARHMLLGWNLPPQALTLVAFNKRAADEIRQRTADLPALQVRTLNSLGLFVVSMSDTVTTIEEREVRTILASLVDLPRRANVDPAAAWIEALSAIRLGLQAPARVEAEFGGDVEGLGEVFERYRKILAGRSLVDFDEQVYRAVEILLREPKVRNIARASCQMLLVDELQDLTPAHLLLIKVLAGPQGAVFGVGDDDQTIYGYSGASPEWLISYKRFFPTAGEHQLEVNYRCPPEVVRAAQTLLTHNHRRVQKRILVPRDRDVGDGGLEVISADDTLAATVDLVASLIEAGSAPGDVAVLSRVNVSLAPVQVAMVHRRLPVHRAVDSTYLLRGGVQAALGWLRLALSAPQGLSGADIALAARRPSRALSPKVIEWMGEQRGITGLERLARRVGGRERNKILEFVSDLKLVHRRASSGSTAKVLEAVRDDIGLDRAMEQLENSRRRLDRSAQTDDLNALMALAQLHPAPEGFEEWLTESLGHPGSPGGVALSTIHKVKGREWPHVVLHEVTAGLVPHRLAIDIEEERRVFHVGLTRGRSSVHVVAGNPPSPFLAELTEEWSPSSSQVEEPGQRLWAGTCSVGAAKQPQASSVRSPTGSNPSDRRRPKPAKPIQPADEEGPVAAAGKEAVEELRRALRQWRAHRAVAEAKPPFVFLHDRTIEAIATSMPSTTAELAQVRGIGPAKLEAFGDELLALVAAARTQLSRPGR